MSDTSLNRIIQYGTSAARIAFTPLPASGSKVLYIWFDIDNQPNTYAWNGTAWIQINSGGGGSLGNKIITLVIDGAGTVITPGIKGFIRIPVNGIITSFTMLADQVGSVVIDIWKDTYANYPPTNADSITNGHEPSIITADKNEDIDLTDWTTQTVNAGDIIVFNVDSCVAITRLTLELTLVL